MQFRPCIDIHNGKVKQIVGSSLMGDSLVQENFVSEQDASYFANLYKNDNLYGGHVIMLDQSEKTKRLALSALKSFPGGLQIGGGINPDNAQEYIIAGASHVIVASYIFKESKLDINKLINMVNIIGKNRLVLDLSCRKQNGDYYAVINKWEKFTDFEINKGNLELLVIYCDEFLIHDVDVDGKQIGIDEDLLKILSQQTITPVTYAGGIKDIDDIEKIKQIGNGKINFTVGSALDIFGGKMKYEKIIKTYAD